MIKLSYHISEEEYLLAMRSIFFSGRTIIYALIACVFLLLNTLMVEQDYRLMALSWVLPLVLILFFWVIILFFSFKRAYRKSAFSKGKLYYGFSDEEIEFEVPDSSGSLKWMAFKKVKDSKAFYFMYTSSVTALIIPKRAFESSTEHDAFRSLLISKSLLKG